MRKLLAAVLVVLVLLAAAGTAVAGATSVQVDGHSMEPTLRDGDRLLPEPDSGGRVRRFDLVLVRRSDRDEVLVKRVIAVPGDRVEIVSVPADPFEVLLQPGGSGPWFRVRSASWTAQAHRASACCDSGGLRVAQAQAQTVPPGRFFYLGDNPDGSDDSRAFGWGEVSLVKARVWMRVWPLSSSGGLGGTPVLEPVAPPQR